MPDRLIATKLYLPDAGPDHIARPRLSQQIQDGLTGKLTLIAAPAGSGKTSVIAGWAATRSDETRLAWVTLDADDNDPARFLRYLLTAVHRALPACTIPADGITSIGSAQTKGILTDLLNQIAEIPQRLVIALDDYHQIENVEIHQAVSFLLDYMPPNLHLMLTTRNDPPLPLARLRTRRQLTEIRSEDLRFTEAEVAQLLNDVLDFNLSAADIAAVERRTEGWIAGIQLAALSMRSRQDKPAFIQAFAGSNRYVMDYLIEEVLAQERAETQQFLLHTSVLDRFTAQLCDHILDQIPGPQSLIPSPSQSIGVKISAVDTSAGDFSPQRDGTFTPVGTSNVKSPALSLALNLTPMPSQSLLAELERRHLFLIPLDDQGIWYRYHHLFADLLRFRLKREQPDAAALLLCRASAWCEEEGLLSEAIHYALTAQSWQTAARLIERHSDYFWFRGELKRLLHWSNQLPAEVVAASSGLCVLKAWTMLPAGEVHDMERYLQLAENALAASEDPARWRGRILSLRAFVARILYGGEVGHTETLAARAHLAEDDLVWQAFTTMNLTSSAMMRGDVPALLHYNDETIALAQHSDNLHTLITSCAFRAQIELDQGSMQVAEAYLKRIEEALQRSHGQWSPLRGFADIVAGRIAYERGDLDAAQLHFDDGISRGQEGEVVDIIIDGLIWSAYVHQLRGQVDRAQHDLDRLHEAATALNIAWALRTADACQARLDLATGKLTQVEAWMARHAQSIQAEPVVLHWWFQIEQFVLVRACMAVGDWHTAQSQLARLIAFASTHRQFARLAELYILQARLCLEQGARVEARQHLLQAVNLAAPGGYLRIFLNDLAVLRPLLQQIDHPFAAEILQQETVPAPSSRLDHPALLDPLNERELEILKRLPEGLSNQAMAAQMFVSVNTVKWYLKEIYSKLGVGNRTQAIERARALNLID